MSDAPVPPTPAAAHPTIRRGAAVAALLLWGAACFLPTFYVGPVSAPGQPKLWTGGEVLAIGWMCPLALTLAWYANIPWAIGVVQALLGRRPGRILTTGAAVLALTMFAMREMYGTNEAAGGPVSWRIGAFVWLASMLPLLVVSWVGPRTAEGQPSRPADPRPR